MGRNNRNNRRRMGKVIHDRPTTSQSLLAMRFEFKHLRSNATSQATEKDWMAEVRKLAGPDATPEKWLEAARKATTKCDHCSGTGIYSWGACVNGKMTHSGTCFRCEGKGRQGQDDYKRNQVYDNHRRVF